MRVLWVVAWAAVVASCAAGSQDPLVAGEDQEVSPISPPTADSGTGEPMMTPQQPTGELCGGQPCTQTCCSGQCVDLDIDSNHCGVCGRSCGEGKACVDGSCACTDPNLTLCVATFTCEPLDTDDHCGMCGHACGGPTSCVDGQCLCPDGSPGDTLCGDACVDTMTDDAHCGRCDMACDAPTSCEAGRCACPGGGRLCGDACVDTMSDAAHCGQCDNPCEAPTSCNAGQCTCPGEGEMPCDGVCLPTASDPNNCGGCGVMCAGDQMCCGGKCIDPETDTNNCGECGRACMTRSNHCVSGECRCGNNPECADNETCPPPLIPGLRGCVRR